jgi:hypothetical protein
MVIKKPILTAMVKTVPIDAFGAVCALSEEHWAESPITVNPKKKPERPERRKEWLLLRCGGVDVLGC